MKKILILIGIGMFCLLNVWTFADDKDAYIGKSDFYLIGSINNKYLIQMQLFRTTNSEIEGTYFYESVNEPIELSGTLKNGILILKENDSRGQITAVFDGKLVNNQLYSGIWRSKISQKQFPFLAERISPKICIWGGEWERIGYYYSPATISIKEINKGSINFAISASSGGNMGEIEGIAAINGNIACYKERATGAEVIIKNHGNAIEVAINQAALIYCGNAVGFNGIFKKGPLKKKVPTLYEMGYFDSINQDRIFRKLVKDDYNSFILNLHLLDDQKCNEIDNLEAEIISGFVRGCPSMRAIIMYTKDNRFWAAVTKDNGINYYTNTESTTAPKTIQAWVKIVADCGGDTTINWVK